MWTPGSKNLGDVAVYLEIFSSDTSTGRFIHVADRLAIDEEDLPESPPWRESDDEEAEGPADTQGSDDERSGC